LAHGHIAINHDKFVVKDQWLKVTYHYNAEYSMADFKEPAQNLSMAVAKYIATVIKILFLRG
jgi:hypothetical protein